MQMILRENIGENLYNLEPDLPERKGIVEAKVLRLEFLFSFPCFSRDLDVPRGPSPLQICFRLLIFGIMRVISH